MMLESFSVFDPKFICHSNKRTNVKIKYEIVTCYGKSLFSFFQRLIINRFCKFWKMAIDNHYLNTMDDVLCMVCDGPLKQFSKRIIASIVLNSIIPSTYTNIIKLAILHTTWSGCNYFFLLSLPRPPLSTCLASIYFFNKRWCTILKDEGSALHFFDKSRKQCCTAA